MKKPNKTNYSTRNTLEQLKLKLKDGYSFSLNKNIQAKSLHKQGDTITITSIIFNDTSPNIVKYRFKDDNGDAHSDEMTSKIFLQYFIDQLPELDIAYKEIEKIKDIVKNDVEKITKNEEVKPKKWHEKIKDKLKGKKKK